MLRPDQALLLGQVAVVVAGMVRQEGGHLGLTRAVLHAGHRLHVRLAAIAHASARPQTMVGRHAVAVGHALLGLGHGGVRQHKVIRHDARQVEQIVHHAVDLVGGQGLGRIPGHGPVHVVPDRRDGGHLHEGRAAREALVVQPGHVAGLDVLGRHPADQRREDLVAFAEHAMTGGAVALPDVLATRHRARALGQAQEVRPHVDVPSRHLLGRGLAADAGVAGGLGPGRGHADPCQQRRSQQAIKRAGHSSPPRSPAPARSGWRCCGKSSGCRAPRAVGRNWAAHSRFRPSRGSAPGPVCRPRPSPV